MGNSRGFFITNHLVIPVISQYLPDRLGQPAAMLFLKWTFVPTHSTQSEE